MLILNPAHRGTYHAQWNRGIPGASKNLFHHFTKQIRETTMENQRHPQLLQSRQNRIEQDLESAGLILHLENVAFTAPCP